MRKLWQEALLGAGGISLVFLFVYFVGRAAL